MLTSRGLGRVLGDLASMGFDAMWGVLGAADVGANHQRDRIWIVAKWRGQLPHAQHNRIGRWEQQSESIEKKNGNVADTSFTRCQRPDWSASRGQEKNPKLSMESKQLAVTESKGLERWNNGRDIKSHESRLGQIGWSVERNWLVEPNLGRVANGVAARVDRIKAIGNGQVPLCAATAWRILSQ